MVILITVLLGLILGSFINALVWRLHQQDNTGNNQNSQYSIINGRSMCPNCKHELGPLDLVPVLSWVLLNGKCRYCHKKISALYPLVELSTSVLFAVSYILLAPNLHSVVSVAQFVIWLIIITILIALLIYDLKWMLLPNKLVFPLRGLAIIHRLLGLNFGWHSLFMLILSLAFGYGLFYGLFIISNGKWIGGGDVKLAISWGILLSNPIKSLMVLFIASVIGTLVILPSLLSKKTTLQSKIPFGPFLILAFIIVYLFGDRLISLFQSQLLF